MPRSSMGRKRTASCSSNSTHVIKTGDDVHYQLFHLLPRVKPGVLIHVHDLGYPFEHPDAWRAFLISIRFSRVLP